MIRHAPVATLGILTGRTDPDANLAGQDGVESLRANLSGIAHWITSPAKRCVQTAQAIGAPCDTPADARLWEQDFGDWDGQPYSSIPDIGALSGLELTRHRPPNGESFTDLCARATPALSERTFEDQSSVVVAHAGIVRAGLALALGDQISALKFEIAPLSMTRLRVLGGGAFSVISVNQCLG